VGKTDPGRDVRRRRRTRRGGGWHAPTFRDRPVEAVVSVTIFALIGALMAYGCTALLVD